MKQQVLYQCELCRTQYKRKEDAIACEKNHKRPLEIVEAKYRPKCVYPDGHPLSITVKFSDGSQRIYRS